MSTADAVQSVINELQLRPGRIFIEGRWRHWDGDRFDQIHPSNNRVLTSFREADQALAAAHNAFDEVPWPRMPAQDRKRILPAFIEKVSATSCR
jgi:aldehyde dehydrogenase (NAD+)